MYEHIRKDNNTVFYVGKGHNRRAWEKGRNQKHDEIADKFGLKVKIVREGLSEEEAYQEEYNTIKELLDDGYGIDIVGLEGNNPNKFLTNQTFGSRGSIGISNPMYGVSPEERMDEDKYQQWLTKLKTRMTSQVGENNPNWHNDTLHNKVKDDPELRIKYYSRPASQNGRCRKIELYDLDWNYINTFDYIGECAQYVKEVTGAQGKIDSIRTNITQFVKKDKPFLNHRYKFV